MYGLMVTQDEIICELGTSAQACQLYGWTNGGAKVFLWELVAVARKLHKAPSPVSVLSHFN